MSSTSPFSNPQRPRKAGASWPWGILLVLGLVASAICLRAGDPARLWRALLVNFIYFGPLSAGLVTWSAVLLVCHSQWHRPLEILALAGAAFGLPSVAALALLWLGCGSAGPWGLSQDLAHKLWLQSGFVFGRDLAALLAFWGLALRYLRLRLTGRGGARAGGLLIFAYCLTFSLIAFDQVMALDPRWSSALFGAYIFISGLYAGITAWALMAAAQPAPDRNGLHDLGRLIVTFSLLTAYMMYSQLLPIWYENLPGEVRFLIPRLHLHSWQGVSALVLAVVYLGPLVMLLSIRAKRTPALIGPIAAVLLAGLWVERWWLVTATFDLAPRLGWEELSVTAAFAGTLGFGITQFLRRVPPVPEPTPHT